MKFKDQFYKLNDNEFFSWLTYKMATETQIVFLEILLEVLEYYEQLQKANANTLEFSLTGDLTCLENEKLNN